MATGPDLIRIGAFPFNLAGDGAHKREDVALGPEGEVPFAFSTWVGGLLSVEEGIEYREGHDKYLHAQGVDASFPEQVIVQSVATVLGVTGGSAALATPLKQVDFVPSGGSLGAYLIGEGRYVHRLTAATPTWTQVLDQGVGHATTDIINANDRLEIAGGATVPVKESTTGAAYVTLSIYADRFGAVNDQLWRAVRPNLTYNTLFSSSPYAWSSAYTVGDSSHEINSLTPVEQVLLIGKEDGAHAIASEGNIVQFSPEFRPQAHTDMASLRGTTSFNNDYYFKTLNGLIQIAGADGMKHRIGLDTLSDPDLPTPRIKALASDDRFLYAILDSTTGVHIIRRSIEGAWHPWYWNASTLAATHIAYSGALGYPTIMFSSGMPATTLFSEVFTSVAAWTAVIGTLGTVASNILTAGSTGTWQIKADTARANGKWSAQFKMVTTTHQWRVQKWVDDNNLIWASWNNGVFELIKAVAGVNTVLATVAQAGVLNNWYWLDLEANGAAYTARFYSSGASPVAKGSATLLQTLNGTGADAAYATGQIALLTTTTTASQWGGVAAAPGGVYVESLVEYVTRFIRTSTYPNPLQDTNYRYDTGASFYIRFGRIGKPGSEIVVDHLLVKSLQTAAGRTIQFQVSIDGGAWNNFGSAVTSGPSFTVIPTTPVTGGYLDFRAVLTTNDATISPVLKGFAAKGVLRPKRRGMHTFVVLLDRVQTQRQGTAARGINETLDDLQTLRNTNTFQPVKDENGRTFEGIVVDVKHQSGRLGRLVEPVPQTVAVVVAEKVAV